MEGLGYLLLYKQILLCVPPALQYGTVASGATAVSELGEGGDEVVQLVVGQSIRRGSSIRGTVASATSTRRMSGAALVALVPQRPVAWWSLCPNTKLGLLLVERRHDSGTSAVVADAVGRAVPFTRAERAGP